MVAEKKVLNISTAYREELLDITRQVAKVVKDSGVKEGVCVIFCSHTTAGLTINENADPSVKKDILNGLDKMIPDVDFFHAEGNSDAHIKACLMGGALNILIQNNSLVLGIWQGIYLCEFDGPRARKVHVQIME